jgi:hypothetical protein
VFGAGLAQVGAEIDQPRDYQTAAGVDQPIRSKADRRLAQSDDAALRHRHIGNPVKAAVWIDDPSTRDQ